MATFLVALSVFLPAAHAGDGQVLLNVSGTNACLQVAGKSSDEWRFQISDDLLSWSNAPELGTVFSDKTSPLQITAGSPNAPCQFYRAVRTEGLFDPFVLRTISLTFTQSNWQTLLKNYKDSGSNLLSNLEMNGTIYTGVGVRYRGNSSYTSSGTKKSVNIQMDYTNADTRLMGNKTVNLNNANGDESLVREALYFNVMRLYTICPHASLVKLNINGDYWGVYSLVEQEDGNLIKEWCPSSDGDRWRAPNMAGATAGGGGMGGGGPGGGGGGGGFSSGTSALTYLGASESLYQSNYELMTENSTNAWAHLVHTADVLNNTATNLLRDAVEDVLAVDRWLWFLAIENIFTDEDSYYYKGADYVFYYEPESGRIHPVEHDGNESSVPSDSSLSPVEGTGNANRPVISRLLAIPELRQRYLAHMRTVLEESVNPTVLNPVIDRYQSLSLAAIISDTKKSYTMAAYSNDVASLKSFLQKRYNYLTNHAELKPYPPSIVAVTAPDPAPGPETAATITAQVQSHGTDGISSVWLYYRDKSYGRFSCVQMFDDGAHGDGALGDGIYGASTTNFAAGNKIHFYVEARSGNSAQAASFYPARAEEDTCSYRVALTTASNPPVVLNELMAANDKTLADPQGQYDDWIELRNLTNETVDMSGRYLSDDAEKPRKWPFPSGTTIPAGGFLLVWADNDVDDTPGLHASFKLPASGGQIFLVDTDAKLNIALDAVVFGAQTADQSYGRTAGDASIWGGMSPTPATANQ